MSTLGGIMIVSKKKMTMGFPISHKENEKRLALVPKDMLKIENLSALYFERGYGKDFNISDNDYLALGCQVVSREEVLSQGIICEPKIGDSDYLSKLTEGTVIFGWVHAAGNDTMITTLLNKQFKTYEWAYLMKGNRHAFWENNQLAGEAAVLDAYRSIGRLPKGDKVAILGRGNAAQGALRVLTQQGAEVTIYNRNQEDLFRQEFYQFDVLINAIMWDNTREDRIIYRMDLKKMKPGTLIIDVSCDVNGAIESTRPTTISEPIYNESGVVHYCVDHTPSLYFSEATKHISLVVASFVDQLIEGNTNDELSGALISESGQIKHILVR